MEPVAERGRIGQLFLRRTGVMWRDAAMIPAAFCRFGVAGAISAALHVALALVVMGMVVRAPLLRSIPVRVVFYDPAPPPPAGPANTAAVSVQSPPQVAKPEPVPHHVKAERKKVFRIAKRSAPTEPQSAMATPAEGITGGEPSGVDGGVPGGIAGGTLGGTGNMLVPAEQAAILPVPISKIIPEYPRIARQRGIEGQVILEAIVGTDGRIEPEVMVIQSVPPFDQATIAALRQWRFRPARGNDGTPVRVSLRVPFRFVLR
jgi:protein TonB